MTLVFSRNWLIVIAAGWQLLSPQAFANSYEEIHRRGVVICEEIDPDTYESGMIFNPAGYRSYYKRSVCFQRLAIEMRDARLCDRVRQRWSLFSSSWGYSKVNCRKLVAEGVTDDREYLAQLKDQYQKEPVRLVDFVVEKNGNGRDYDIIPRFTVGFKHSYRLAFRILANEGEYLLSESAFYLDGDNNIRMFEYRRDIEKRFPDFKPGSTYRVQAELTLSIGDGTSGARWSPAFIDSTFPTSQRTQMMAKSIIFHE